MWPLFFYGEKNNQTEKHAAVQGGVMKFSESLKKNSDFQAVYGEKNSLANRSLVMYVRKNGLEKNRLGISVSKKVGNSVVRHRITRLIRESYRLNEHRFLSGYDLVIVARIYSKGKSQREIESSLLHLAGLHKITVNYEKDFD